MNTEDKRKLELKIKDEIQHLSAYADQEVSPQNPESDPNVKTEALVVQAVDRHTQAEARKKVAALRKTLENIRDESFGFCTGCGTAIPLERLLIVPETDKCPDCAA